MREHSDRLVITRYADHLSPQQAEDLRRRLEGRGVARFTYEREGSENYFILYLDDETKITFYYGDGHGGLTVGEGFP